MNLNEQLRQAYESGRRQGLNEQGGMAPGDMGAKIKKTSLSTSARPDALPPTKDWDWSSQYILDQVRQWYGHQYPPKVLIHIIPTEYKYLHVLANKHSIKAYNLTELTEHDFF